MKILILLNKVRVGLAEISRGCRNKNVQYIRLWTEQKPQLVSPYFEHTGTFFSENWKP